VLAPPESRAHECLDGEGTLHVLGWFHLYQTALQIERALGNREGARSAAHGLWRFAVLSGNLYWETNAAHAMCLSNPNDNDPEVITALGRLRAMSTDVALPAASRVMVLENLIICEWSLKHHEAAVERILELLAFGA